MISVFKNGVFFLVLSSLFTSCSNSNFTIKKIAIERQLASDEGSETVAHIQRLQEEASKKSRVFEIPPGVTDSEQFEMWHASEGSDIYPTLWLLNLKSFLSYQKGSFFFENLDKKYGLIKSPYQKNPYSPYAWIGLTATWDEEQGPSQDLFLSRTLDFKNLSKVKKLSNGKKIIAMTGASCAFCHTGSVLDEQMNPIVIDGAPATIDMKGFFYDIIGSTYQTMFDEDELASFYERMNVQDGKSLAKNLTRDFKKDLGIEDTLFTEAIALFIKAPIIGKKINKSLTVKASTLLYEKREILTKYLIRMLKETYGLDEITPLMKKRMEYLTWFGAPNPDVISTHEGYGRTDAFGRISNATIRLRSYTHLTAPVSLPPMYAMKYKAFYHYNANTNSLISRNIGQAFGLGAITTGEVEEDHSKLDSTVHIPNLVKLEKLIYKVPVPEYVKVFNSKEIDVKKVVEGCDVYLNKCIQCHTAHEERVGPEKKLLDHKLVKLETINTDRQYIKNISAPALGIPFKKAIFSFTDKIKDGYYTKHDVDQLTQEKYAQESIRGKEIFRDTFLGEFRFRDDPILNYANIESGYAYVARDLAGVWSTAPYLHNGSVPNLYELLLPSSKRTKKFIVGNLAYDHLHLGFVSALSDHPRLMKGEKPCKEQSDPFCFDTSLVGNSNTGHEPSMYGGELTKDQKMSLIEFLKVLAPELEHSWSSLPVYKIENNKCFIR